jgi:NAD kinase
MKIEYAIIVKNKTRLENLIERFNTKAQARFYIESLGGDFEDYEKENERFYQALGEVQMQLSSVLKYKIIDRSFLPSFLFYPQHLIIVIGQDGLVANTAKYAKNCPIIAINPDKERYDGVLLPFEVQNFLEGVEGVRTQQFEAQRLSFAEAKLNNGQRLLAFNDLFIGAASHVSARYKIAFSGKEEEHSSSGLIVSTKAGSTGWLSSIFNMAYGVAGLFEGNLQIKQPQLAEDDLLFAVREPFKSIKTQTNITIGKIRQQNRLSIESLMPNNGVIFSDGIEKDFIPFNSGAKVEIGVSTERAILVINN